MTLPATVSVLVTGASRNLGRACAVRLASAGANVVVNARSDEAGAEEVAAACRQHGVQAIVAMGDVGIPSDVERMVDAACRKLGSLNAYVANAAIRPRQSMFEMTYEDWGRVLATNLSSAFYLAKNIVPLMRDQGWGRIVHVSGADGFVGYENRVHNVTAKAGIHGLTKAMAKELGPLGITVNTVVPGAFDTTRSERDYPNWDADEMASQVPVRRLGKPDEFADACRYIILGATGYLSAHALHLNGGQFAI